MTCVCGKIMRSFISIASLPVAIAFPGKTLTAQDAESQRASKEEARCAQGHDLCFEVVSKLADRDPQVSRG
jgi:hypothetical protein